MSDENSVASVAPLDVVLDIQSIPSSEESPINRWSSLIIQNLLQKTEEDLQTIKKSRVFDSAEICTKYISVSDSEVYEHPYYKYLSVKDPGITEALLEPEPKVVYPNNGQELYLALCKEMNQCPVRIFYNSLTKTEINLRYYCVEPRGVRAMAEALKYNQTVLLLDLTDNFLSDDACYHLGDLLSVNAVLLELDLSGCRIGPEGVKILFAGLVVNRTLKILNLSRNALTDTGGVFIADALSNGLDIEQLNLSYNGLGSKTAAALAEAWEFYNRITHLDLSRNNLFMPAGTCNLLKRLEENLYLEELYLSWNALSGAKIASAIQSTMKAPKLHLLDLSNNKLQGEAIDIIVANLAKAKNLHTLNLSFNPLNSDDAFKVISKLKLKAVHVKRLYMDNVDIKADSLHVLQRLQKVQSKMDVTVTFGGVLGSWKAKGPDPREIVLNRVEYLTKSKKHPVDFALLVLQLVRNNVEFMELKEFQTYLKENHATMINDDLVDEIVNTFPGPKSKKFKKVNISTLAEFIKRKWPDRKLPPPQSAPPPPEPPQSTAPLKDAAKK